MRVAVLARVFKTMATLLALGMIASSLHGEGAGRKRFHAGRAALAVATPDAALDLAVRPEDTGPCPTDESGWISWREVKIRQMLTLRPASKRNIANGHTEPYLSLEQVMVEASAAADRLDVCGRTGTVIPPSLANLRLFATTQRNANYLREPARHQFGHGVDDDTYLARIEPIVLTSMPCLLKSQGFLKQLTSWSTLKEALTMIERQNRGEAVNGCASDGQAWLPLVYRSRFLGTPDLADVLGRLLVIVPAPDDAGHDRWVQFGIHTEGEQAQPGRPILNVSVVAVARGAVPPDASRFDALVDLYRCRGDCKVADPAQPITLHYRYRVTGITGNCQECHKMSPLSIHPAKVWDRQLIETDPESFLDVQAINALVEEAYRRPPAFVTGADDALAGPAGYGPPLGARPQDFGIPRPRTTAAVAHCAPALDEAARQRVARAMNCGRCHSGKPTGYGAVNYPQATEKRNSDKLTWHDADGLPETGDDLLDLAPNPVQAFVLAGIMPPSDVPGGVLATVEEREALYRCLSQEYFDPARLSGLFVDWLRQEAIPPTLVAATSAPGPVATSAMGPAMAPAPATAPARTTLMAAADYADGTTVRPRNWSSEGRARTVGLENCLQCHQSLRGRPALAPSLVGVLGRRMASAAFDGYSPALRQLGEAGMVWNEARLLEFLQDPDAFLRAWAGAEAESTKQRAYPDEALRRRIVEQLKQLR